jgi:hypothetical protein
VRADAAHPSVHFEPVRPASRGNLVAGIVVGPLLWLAGLIVAAFVFEYSWAIAVGLLATVAAFLVSLAVLAVLRTGRKRQEERFRKERHADAR